MADGKQRVLVVDDEPNIAKIVKKQLEVSGYEVIVAVDGEEALTKIRQEHPDVMLLDVMLPKRNGYEVLGIIKQDEQLKRIPVMMLTARAQQQDQQASLEHGADAYLAKPFQLEELVEQVRALLDGSSAGA
jgi:two-component system alkaline phosphatase synthesis response regulator PhoP